MSVMGILVLSFFGVLLLGAGACYGYRLLLSRVLLSRIRDGKRGVRLPSYTTVFSFFLFAALVLLAMIFFQALYERDVPKSAQFFLTDTQWGYNRYLPGYLWMFAVLGIADWTLHSLFDCVRHKSFRLNSFGVFPVALHVVLLVAVGYLIYLSERVVPAFSDHLYLCTAIVYCACPLVWTTGKAILCKRRAREIVWDFGRTLFTLALALLLMFLGSRYSLELPLVAEWIVGGGALLGLLFDLVRSSVQTVNFFSELRAKEEEFAKRTGEEREDEVFKREMKEALSQLPQRFFLHYRWALLWKFPHCLAFWERGLK